MGLILQFLESATLTASTPSPATVTVNTGLPGPKGEQGDAATIAVASTTTLAPGSSATVENVGTSSAASLAFGIPRGDVGQTGATGQKGDKGDTGAGVATGGVTNQILAKTSNADFATGWINPPDLTPYLLSATAASTYLTQSNAASTYATQTALASYLTTAVASSTYQTLAGMSSYLTTATAASTYAPIAAGVPTGGSAGMILTKNSGTNYDAVWSTPASSSVSWGQITGTLSAQGDLDTALGLKATLASPTFTGTPAAPTAATSTNTTQIATTAFVKAQAYATLASPTFTGTPVAPTAGVATNTTQIATTAFVKGQAYATLASPTFTGDPKAPTPSTADNDTSIATTAFVKAQAYAPLASPTFTGTVTIPAGASISGYLTTATAATTYAPIAAGVPTGGTTGMVLTKSSGTNYDAGWSTPTVGDRYSTTSTTSLTISNGSKTLTVAAGLSYTPTQDVTIAYSATPTAHHMHAQVTSYSGTTLVVDVSQHTGTGTFSAWTVNVGGISSIATWGQITGTLSAQGDLDSALSAKLDSSTASTTYAVLAPNDGSYYLQKNGAWEVVNIS